VTTPEIESFPAPDTSRAARTVELMRLRAAEQLEGKSVWCIAAAPTEPAAPVRSPVAWSLWPKLG
jgi:hypothetical protein